MPCAAVMQGVHDWYTALFSPATNTMQLYMWQRDIVGVAQYIMGLFWGAWYL